MSSSYYQYGRDDPSKVPSMASKAPQEELLKEPITYTYIPPQAAPQEPKPEPAKGPTTYTYLPPQMQHQQHQPSTPAPFAMGQCYAPFGMVMTPVTYMPVSCDGHGTSLYAPPGTLCYPTVFGAPASPPPAPVAVGDGTVPWLGATKAEVDAQNAHIANNIGATKPVQLIPYEAADGQQFWVRELDGAYTLRTTNDIMENCQPGRWTYGSAGYPYFVRAQPAAPAT